MSYIGEEGRVVSSNYLFNMLQDLYTKIKGLLANKADKDHTHDFTVTDAETAKSAYNSIFVIPNNDSNDIEGGELRLTNQDGSVWHIDSYKNNFRIFDPNGNVHLSLRTDSTDTFSGNADSATNSDTLDGYHASSFAKLNEANTFTNTVTIQSGEMNGAYNGLLVGDDCYIGDCNIANTIGLMGVTNNNIAYMKFGTSGKQLGFNGSNLVYDDSVVVTEKTGTALSSKGLNSTGFGIGNLTYYQTANDFYDNTGWCHYIIANHQDGASYYNYTLGLPFWDAPMYQRQTGNTTAKSGWQKFYTTENITYGTAGLTAGSSRLATGHIYLQYE